MRYPRFAVNALDGQHHDEPCARPRERAGRYELFGELGAGGMSSVVLARLLSAAGFSRTVAIKRPLAGCAPSPDLQRRAAREARLASRVHHANVVSTLDVVEHRGQLLVVLEYVRGETLASLMRRARERGERVPLDIAAACVVDALRGLSAVHEARDEHGRPLELIHRDVSPQNILCGADGVARLGDFGLAKSALAFGSSSDGNFVGKLAYASPEQLDQRALTHASDIYAMGLVLWELVAGEQVYGAATPLQIVARLLHEPGGPPLSGDVPGELRAVVERALSFEPERRFASAATMALALEALVTPASTSQVAEWVCRLAADALAQRDALVAAAERKPSDSEAPRSRRPASALLDPVAPMLSAALTATSLVAVLINPSSAVSVLEVPAVQAPLATTSVGGKSARVSATSELGVSEARPSEQLDPTRNAERVNAPARRSSRHSRAPASALCSPPFSLDTEGIRHMKPNCR